MASESSVFGTAVVGIIVGLAVLLWGAEHGQNTLVAGGGIVVLAAIGLMTVYLNGMDGPADGH